MQRIAIILLPALFCLPACGDLWGGGNLELDEPTACTIEPAVVTVEPQSIVAFAVECDTRFEVDDDAVGRSYSPDGGSHELEFTAPELPGQYNVTVVASGYESVRATAVVTVEAAAYAVSTDMVWSSDLENHRVWYGPDDTIVVESAASVLTFYDAELNIIGSYDGWYGRFSGDIEWSSDRSILYLLGTFYEFQGSSELVARFDWTTGEIQRWYGTPNSTLIGDYRLELSPDEMMGAWWLPNRLIIREMEGDRTIFAATEIGLNQGWSLGGIGYPEGREFYDLYESFQRGGFNIQFSPDGSRALIGGAFFVDLDTGLLLNEEPISFEEICRSYSLSDGECPNGNAILIDNDRVLAFDWPDGRPAIFNLTEGTIETAPRSTGVFVAVEPEFDQIEFTPDRERVLITTSGDSVFLDLTTSPVSLLWNSGSLGTGRGLGALSPDGTRAVVLNYVDPEATEPFAGSNVTILDAVTGEPLLTRERGARDGGSSAVGVIWSPDGTMFSAQLGRHFTMFTDAGTPLWDSEPNPGYYNWIGERLARIRREPASRQIEAIEFRDPATNELLEGELVLDFGTRESRFLNDEFYTNPDASMIWITSDTMGGGMAFDTATGAWDESIVGTPEWATVQMPPEQPIGPEPREACDNPDNPMNCTLHFVCGAWDPTGSYMIEGWNEGINDARSAIISFRIVDSNGTPGRNLELYTLGNCEAVAWHPTEPKVAVVDGSEILVVNASNPLGTD